MNTVSDTQLVNNWIARGRLYGSETGAWWMSGGAYAFMPVVEANGIVRFFACGRDDLGRSRIGILSYQWGDTPKLLDVTFEKYQPLGKGWVAPEVVIKVDGKEVQREVYRDIRADVALQPDLYDTETYHKARWIGGQP